MEQLKAASVCIRLCRNRWAHWVRVVELIKVVGSSGGIAAWVVWRDYPFVWSGIIALAQLLDAVKNLFPFAKLHRAASDLTVALELLFIDAQYEWEEIYAGKMGDDDIMAARRKMQKLRLEAEQKFFPEGFQPASRFVELATNLTVSQVGSLATGASGQSPGDTSGQPNADACDGRFDVAFCSDRGIRGVDNRWVGQTF